jgi:anaerobic magnesium-protoporphyrin IX monomethyl ester cyclase
LRGIDALLVAVGPHGSATPHATLRKLDVDVVLQGECEQAILALADAGRPDAVPGAAWFTRIGDIKVNGPPVVARFTDAPPLVWPDAWIRRHRHHHHRFDTTPQGPGAEVEASRGCPYECSFCAKIDFRDSYRRRNLGLLLAEIDRLISQGVTYLYFIDEIFLPQRPLLLALRDRAIKFGVQTRIDLWKPDMITLLGEAGCVSIEAGVESLTPEGRAALDKNCRLSTEELSERLVQARSVVPFVQANLIRSAGDDMAMVAAWRDWLRSRGVWANDPVPMFPYPSSPDYRRLWGNPDDEAWERAHAHYLGKFDLFSDIQDSRPLPLPVLEDMAC